MFSATSFCILQEIWTTQPIIATVMFGLPLLLFSFIIYMLCTAEGGDDQEYNDEDEFDDEDGDGEQRDALNPPPVPQEQETKQPGKPKTE
jgi:hypothetical protein